MDLAEAFLKHIFSYVLEHCADDMEFFNQRIDNTVLETAHNIINSEFARITYTEAISLLETAIEKGKKKPLSTLSRGALTCSQNMSATSPKNTSKNP